MDHQKLIVKSMETYTSIPPSSSPTQQPKSTKKNLLPRRLTVALLAFLGFCNLYILRVNLSVAIVSLPFTSLTKGLILSSFFYGYILTQLPGGWLARQYGGKSVFGYGILITAILSLLTPPAARAGPWILSALRFLQGLAEGVTYPAIHHLHSKWSPIIERSRLVTIAFSGSYVGTVIALPTSGLLADYYGWPWIFYVFGVVALVWAGVWFATVAEEPNLDRWIGEEEVLYINSSVGEPPTTSTPPWPSILRSPPVWAINAAHFSENWGFYLLLTLLPTYMSHTFHYTLSKSGLISALPYLVMALLLQSSGALADWLRTKSFTTTQVRKLFTCGAFLAQCTFVVAAAFTSSPTGSIVCLTGAVGLDGFCWTGFGVNHLDLAPQYAGLLMGVSNTFATIPGIISPVIGGWLTSGGTAAEWRVVFFISGFVYLVGCLLYGWLADGEVQEWGRVKGGGRGDSDTEGGTSCVE